MDPYKALGVQKNSSQDEIQKAYRKLAKTYHPDKNPNNPESETKFKEVAEAYEILGDPEKKSQYDTYGFVGNQRNMGGRPFNSVFDDLFSGLFRDRRQVQKGQDLIVECHVKFDDVLNGGMKEIPYAQALRCGTCNGLGGKEDKCPHCDGSGTRTIFGSAMTVRTTCAGCNGTGRVLVQNCPDCRSGFNNSVEKSLSFEIRKGVEDGMRFVYQGQGNPSPNPTGIPGDLCVIIRLQPHQFFGRLRGGDIICKVPVSYTQLVLGGEIEVPTLESRTVIEIPAKSSPNRKFRLRGLGLPASLNSNVRGDQFVEVELQMPKNISPRYKELLEDLSNLEKGEDGRSQE